MTRGILISFEGGEGGGKTTQIKLIKERLVQQHPDIVTVREPGGTDITEQIREVVLSAKNKGIAYTTEVLLFQAARAQLYSEVVLPSLEAGKLVLIDRTRDSSVVYQGMVRKFGVDAIEQLNNISTKETFPDLTLLLDVPAEVGLQRRAGTGEVNRLDMSDKTFHEEVRSGYLKLAKHNDHNRWVVIDASKKLDEVTGSIWKVIMARFPKLAGDAS